MDKICLITTTIACIGAINYLFVAIPRSNDDKDCKRDLNLIKLSFNKVPSIEKSLYILFAISGIFTIYCTFFKDTNTSIEIQSPSSE